MKISLVVPVKNEEIRIADFLESLLNQQRKPDEIIIVDGGSVDRTKEIVNKYIRSGMPIKLIQADQALPGKGRNIGFKAAKYNIIAMADGDTLLDKMWLKRLIAPFEQDPTVEVVYGTFDCYSTTFFEQCFCLVYVPAAKQYKGYKINFPFVASSAVKRNVWEQIGGFVEDLRSTEDLVFIKEIKRRNFKVAIAPQAKVYWRARRGLQETFYLSFRYSICDASANTHLLRYLKKYFLYLLAAYLFYIGLRAPFWLLALLAGFLLNLLLVCRRHWGDFLAIMRKRPYALLYISSIILALDISQLLGFAIGKIKKYSGGFSATSD